MVHGDIEKPALQELADYVQKLISVGAIGPSDEMEQMLLEYGGLPQQEPTEPAMPAETGQLDLPLEIPSAPETEAIALNGAQVTSLVEIVRRVTENELSRASAIEIMMIAFPSIDRAKAAAILG
jgi:hypothetical protein